MTMTEAVQLLDAFVRYAYNAEFDEFRALFPQATEDYLLEKYRNMQQRLGGFYGELDPIHREMLIELIVARYQRKEGKRIEISS